MKREQIGAKEINLSHELSGKKNLRKENKDLLGCFNIFYLKNLHRKSA